MKANLVVAVLLVLIVGLISTILYLSTDINHQKAQIKNSLQLKALQPKNNSNVKEFKDAIVIHGAKKTTESKVIKSSSKVTHPGNSQQLVIVKYREIFIQPNLA